MAPNKLNSFLKLLLICELLCLSKQSDTQYMEFFSDDSCASSNGVIWDTNKTLIDIPGFGDALSIKVNGMWEYQEPSGSSTQLTLIFGVDACSPKYPNRGPYSVAERYGNSNLNESEIAFCTEGGLEGIRFTIPFTEIVMVLPKPIMMLSWFFTGIAEWSVYPNSNFTGGATCLFPQPVVINDGHGITFDWRSRLLVGSAHRGCIGGNSARLPVSPTSY